MKNQKLDSRLSIRLEAAEHRQFSLFCKEKGVTQRDGFLMLLSQADNTDAVEHRIQQQAQQIATQRRQLSEKDSLIKNGSRGANADKKLIEALRFCKVGVHHYTNLLFQETEYPPPLKCHAWNEFIKNCPQWQEYAFPKKDCFLLFRLENMCYSHGGRGCLFLFGRDVNTNKKTRFRFYNIRQYFGPHPTGSPYFFKGNCFLVGGKQKTDGACDLCFAMPLPFEQKDDTPYGDDKAQKTIDEILWDAGKRSR